MDISFSEILGWFNTYFWVFTRIAAMIMAMPVLSSRLVTMRIRLFLAITMTVVVAPGISNLPAVDPLSFDGLLLLTQQVLIGVTIGFVMQVVFQIFIVGGQLIAMQSGLGFSSLVDPQTGVNIPVVGQIYLMLTTLIFLSIDGHLAMFQIVHDSFTTLPISTEGIVPTAYKQLAYTGSWLFSGAIIMALPMMVTLLMVNLALGVMTKAAPTLNIFSVGFPITLTLGIFIVWIGLLYIYPQIISGVEQGLGLSRSLVGL